MNHSFKLINKDYYFFSLSASLVIHIIILLVCFIIIKKSNESYYGKAIDVQLIQGGKLISDASDFYDEKLNNPDNKTEQTEKAAEKEISNNASDISNNNAPLKTPDINTRSTSGYYNFNGTGNDTSGLVQLYAEKTLNVKIKYPLGWTFVDQDRHNKLDGVTFWANNGIFDPPPYIFLEVKEKYLFNPSRYKFNTKLENSIAYYNDPEELEGQVSQVFYIRTETDEDYSIKLIMNGKDMFIAFQPIFFAMIKSFNFGKSLF